MGLSSSHIASSRMSLKSASSETDSLDCIGHIIRKLRGGDPNAQEKINNGEPDEMVRKIFKNIYTYMIYRLI